SGDDQGWNGPLAEHWAAHVHRHEAGYRHLTPELLAAARIEPAQSVLDVGCGAGLSTLRAADAAGEDGRVLGVDVSRRLVAVARCRAAAARVRNVRFHCADAAGYPFERGGFDRVLSQFGLQYFPDPAGAFGTLARALRPGGLLAFLCWREQAANAFDRVPNEAVARFVRQPPPHPGAPGAFSLADPERIRALLDGARFADVRITPLDVPMWLGHTVADAADFLLSSPAGRARLATADTAGAAAAGKALTEALAPFRGEEGVELGCAAWLVTATH
ncbi:MAG TPA: methyltransferase domain-containing protein, partial [Actinospica sp.]|nr:methyltransferase domain-containing protein [Actinospica sp.]